MDLTDSALNLAILMGGVISGIILGLKTKFVKKLQDPKSDPDPKLPKKSNGKLDTTPEVKVSVPPVSDKKNQNLITHCVDHNSIVKSNQDIIDLINKNHKEVKGSLKDINMTLMSNAREAGSFDARVTAVEKDVEWLKDRP